MLLRRHTELIIRRGPDILGLGPADGPRRMLPDLLFDKACPMPEDGLAYKLGSVSALDAHIFMLIFVNLAMHKGVCLALDHPARLFDRAGLFQRFLLCQLFTG